MGKFSKYIYFTLGIAGALLLYNMLKKKKKQDNEVVPGVIPPTSDSITPVSGTSQTILDNLDESEADLLKEELNN